MKRAEVSRVVSGPKVGNLLDPRNGRIVHWTPEMFAALDKCVVDAATISEMMRVIGVEHATLARGLALRLRQLLMKTPHI